MGKIKEIDVVELKSIRANAPTTRVVDVRTPEEFDEGHADIVNCNIPLDSVSGALFARTGFSDKSEALYIICRSGARSMRACEILSNQGYENLTNIAGGTLAWSKAGYGILKK